jgi:hypothetical protein
MREKSFECHMELEGAAYAAPSLVGLAHFIRALRRLTEPRLVWQVRSMASLVTKLRWNFVNF